MTNQFPDRHAVEQYMAELTTYGAIVEVGVGFGNGQLALARGNKNGLPVFGIDPYLPYVDPLGGTYGPDTMTEMQENTASIDFTHIRAPAFEVSYHWTEPVGLLWIDLSMRYDDLRKVFYAWTHHLIPDGYVCITGLSYPNQLGTRRLMEEALMSGEYSRLLPEQEFVAVLKKNKRQLTRAAFYIANGWEYEAEALVSANSVKKWLGIPSYLFAVHQTDGLGFEATTILPPKKFDGWYRNQVVYFNQAVEQLKDYDQLLYLDTDTFMCRDCSGIWDILTHYDMALGHAAGRGATPTAVNCPSEFATLGIGVEFFNNTPEMRRFFRDWQAQFEAHYNVYEETDEGPFRDLLFLNYHGIRYFVLAPEEHCRFGFGCWLNGKVSILHGRVDVPLEQIEAEINRQTSMRLYRYNGPGIDGMFWYHKIP